MTVERIPASWEIIESASQIKAEDAVSYADCFVTATALKYSAAVVTGDSEFKKIEHLAEIDWI